MRLAIGVPPANRSTSSLVVGCKSPKPLVFGPPKTRCFRSLLFNALVALLLKTSWTSRNRPDLPGGRAVPSAIRERKGFRVFPPKRPPGPEIEGSAKPKNKSKSMGMCRSAAYPLIHGDGPVKRAALYMHVSTLEQCPETQGIDLRQFADQRGYEIVQESIDHGVSGAKTRRRALDTTEAFSDCRRYQPHGRRRGKSRDRSVSAFIGPGVRVETVGW
jgi:hypothetical protein